MRTMGYLPEDNQEIYSFIEKQVKNNFLAGKYILKNLSESGQHFTINMVLNGKRDHANEKFNCHIGCVAWPFGKIKIATPLLKD